MEGNFSDKLMRIDRAALFGFLGGTTIIHIAPIESQVIRGFESRHVEQYNHEYKAAVLPIAGFRAMVTEPIMGIVAFVLSLARYGPHPVSGLRLLVFHRPVPV